MRNLTFIVCSVLAREAQTFLSHDYPEAKQIFLDSVLHIYPQKLYKAVETAIETQGNQNYVLIYGDCSAHMKALSQRSDCERTEAVNCGELLLGTELYKAYRNKKVFLFLPEWTERWQEVFQRELGFSNPSLAQEFMHENQRSFIYLDTEIIPIPWKHLKAISEFFNMPTKVVTVSCEHFRQSVKAAVERLEAKNNQ
ncbi:MAG: DUF1638 domain-containing protein [Desulforhopalus sp.]